MKEIILNANPVSIKNLYAGKPDAKDEINFGQLDEFIRTFVVADSFNVESLLDGNNCFITGYKGTGKTALLFYLDDKAKRNDVDSCSSFIFFKEEFTDIKKTQLEDMSKRVLSSISIAQDTMIDNTDFEYIWRWLLFKRIVSDNEEYSNGLFKIDSEWQAFYKTISKIKAPSDAKKNIIPPNVKLSFSCSDNANMASVCTDIDIDLQNMRKEGNFSKFIEVIDTAEKEFQQLTRTDIPYRVFIDELEAYYGDEHVFKRDLYLIRDLIFTVKRFNTIFVSSSMKNTKIICSVRNEILNSISRFIITKELNKVTSGFEVPLLWDYSNTNSHSHPIIQILLKRIGVCEEKDCFNDKDIYQRWFPEKIHDIEPANYILNNSWCKPRDIVRLIISAQNCIQSHQHTFSQSVFSALHKRYSLDSLTEIKEEMRALYNPSQIDAIVNCFTGYKTIFSVKQLKARIDEYYADTIWTSSFNQILQDLYRLGFLGNYLPSSQTYRWQHKGDDGVILADEWRLMIHYALQSALSIGRKQDIGLLKNEPLQTGDMVNATVTKIIQSFILVTFEHYGKEYNGSIHISEISSSFVKNIYEFVSEGDDIRVKVISYNDKYANWNLSLRF